MLPRSLANMAVDLNAKVVGDALISGLAIDSRQAKDGDLFVALIAERDGHTFIDDAARSGASAALVSHPTSVLPSICVSDTQVAMTALARSIRASYAGTVLALTGSQGKTSTRGFLASILLSMARRMNHNEILVTQGNLNNHLGVPLTIARLRPHHPFALFELGASAVGEIADLASIAQPHISALLNARAAHLEGFGSIAGVIQGKGEIIDHTDPDGTVILNADEPALEQWSARAGHRHVMTFGRQTADVRWTPMSQQDVRLDVQDLAMTVRLPTLGQHFMENAAAAAAMALAAGATDEDIRGGLESAVIEPGRMTPIQLERCLLVDDTYNASPQAVRAAIDWLAHQSGHRILVMGGLSELGDAASSEMKALGAYAKSQGIDQLVATGTAAPIAEGFGVGSFYAETIEETVSHLSQMVARTDAMLIKGSRSAHMNRVVDAFQCQQGGQ